jgi:hypothetical protein
VDHDDHLPAMDEGRLRAGGIPDLGAFREDQEVDPQPEAVEVADHLGDPGGGPVAGRERMYRGGDQDVGRPGTVRSDDEDSAHRIHVSAPAGILFNPTGGR